MAAIWQRLIGSRTAIAALIGALVFGLVATLRELGILEFVELGAFDWLLSARPRLVLEDNPVVLIKIGEHEIQEYGHPLCDTRIAVALDKLLEAGTRGIGVDIYRDSPVTYCGGKALDAGLPEVRPELAEVATRDNRVVMLAKPLEQPPIAPPAFLEGTDQVAVPDVPVDPNGIVHRAIIYYNHDDATYFPLSVMLAIRHLWPDGIGLENDPERPELVRLGAATIPDWQPNDGGYVDALIGGYQYMLDYALGHEGFPSFSLDELYDDAIPPEALAGKIAILGTDSTTVKDEFYTPLSARMPGDPFMLGMELHAHAVAQLIRMAHGQSPPLTSWSERAEYLWIALWCALGTLLGNWNRSAALTAFCGAAGFAMLGGASYAALERNVWIPLVPPMLGGFLSAGLIGIYRAIAERQERRQVTGLFSRFLRPEVADLIWQQRDEFIGNGNRPRARSVTITSLMSDLQGYTTASEAMSPEDLMGWINEYMNIMADLVGDHGGVVDDYAGDGIKANFGFPVPSITEEAITEDARNAVRCALAMGVAMDRLNESWRVRNMPTGRVRVGIYTGQVVVGILGGGRSMKYTTVGDTVNTAARLESFDKDAFSAEAEKSDWRVLIGDGTMERLGGGFRTEDLGSHSLKGKHEATRIFRVFGPSEPDAAEPGPS